MANKFYSRRNLDFLLNEVFDVLSLTQYPYFEDHSEDTIKMVIDTAQKIATNMMYPLLSEMDKEPPHWENGHVHVHPMVRPFLKEMGDGGWIHPEKPYDIGGQQLPLTIKEMGTFIFSAANYSLQVFHMLTGGAANLIYYFGTQEMKDLYLEKMYNGQWQGTMALTEPDVGSSLGDLTTAAEPTDKDYYMIKGKKIFISAGNHDGVDNVIHLMLARIKGAPQGVAGISLFVVPQLRYTDDGSGLEDNDVQCGGIEHKLGYRGSPIAQLSMGEEKNCRGYLVGEAGKGLSYMFMMMNEERINVGIGAISKISAAYYASLEYAQQRTQGRKLSDKNPNSPMVPLIEHPDVKRMLLFQKSIIEGSLSLAIQVCMYQDLEMVGVDKEKNTLLIDFLIPILKTYPAEMGILSASAAIQVLGGYGYCGDFPVEQYYRDIRIDTIHEGTTCVQAQDILNRKVSMKQGKAYELYIEEVNNTIAEAKKFNDTNTKEMVASLEEAMDLMKDLTKALYEVKATGTPEDFLADAVLYLEFMSIIAISWQWLKQHIVAMNALAGNLTDTEKHFYQGKVYTARFFFDYELPKTKSLAYRLYSKNKVTVEITSEYFED